MFTEDILSLSESVSSTVSVKHMSFVSKLEAIHYRNVCTETQTQAHTSAAEDSGYQHPPKACEVTSIFSHMLYVRLSSNII